MLRVSMLAAVLRHARAHAAMLMSLIAPKDAAASAAARAAAASRRHAADAACSPPAS